MAKAEGGHSASRTDSSPTESDMEYLGGHKFAAQDYDLHCIPNNERAGRHAAAMMPYIRTCELQPPKDPRRERGSTEEQP
jgi:hypothetical protein